MAGGPGAGGAGRKGARGGGGSAAAGGGRVTGVPRTARRGPGRGAVSEPPPPRPPLIRAGL